AEGRALAAPALSGGALERACDGEGRSREDALLEVQGVAVLGDRLGPAATARWVGGRPLAAGGFRHAKQLASSRPADKCDSCEPPPPRILVPAVPASPSRLRKGAAASIFAPWRPTLDAATETRHCQVMSLRPPALDPQTVAPRTSSGYPEPYRS